MSGRAWVLGILPGLGLLVLMAWIASTTWAREDVLHTKHNLSANPNVQATGTTRVCVFCHTPHGGDTTVGEGAAPLWNRSIPTST